MIKSTIRWIRWYLRRTRPWSPYDKNGRLRDDLFAVKRVDGKWVPNTKPNDGFYPMGAIRKDDLR